MMTLPQLKRLAVGMAVVAGISFAANVILFTSNHILAKRQNQLERYEEFTSFVQPVPGAYPTWSLVVAGNVGALLPQKLQKEMELYKPISTLYLCSPGGNGDSASALLDSLREKNLTTVAVGKCASACTYLWIAGSHRFIAGDAKIRFHSPGNVCLIQSDSRTDWIERQFCAVTAAFQAKNTTDEKLVGRVRTLMEGHGQQEIDHVVSSVLRAPFESPAEPDRQQLMSWGLATGTIELKDIPEQAKWMCQDAHQV